MNESNENYFEILNARYNSVRINQAHINSQLKDIEDKLNEKLIDFETLERIKELYRELNETNNKLIYLAQEMLKESEKS